ncbi:MAG TPA: glycosyl transferase family 36 [Ignavibacteriaceae bacterium]|nr:glycosyl transferase family 36 [Ignavibacteriaceae bacterium]
MFKNKYGYFSEDYREFVITDPRTPRPWFNYMWNENYTGLVSHTGGGFSYLETPRDNRLTRMRYNSLPWDRPGRYVIIKDAVTGKYWSLSWAPTIELKYDKYKCRHGQGYTKITTEINGIKGEITYFVSDDVNAEFWMVNLTNLSNKERKLEVYSFTELLMGNALNDLINQPNDKHFTEITFNKETQTLEATRRYWVLNKKVSVVQPNIDWKYKIYFTQTLPVSGFDSSLDNFIGKWRSEANPISIETGKMTNTEITAGDPVAALKSKLILKPKTSKDFSVIMAVAPKEIKNPYKSLKWDELKNVKTIQNKFSALKEKWGSYLSNVNIQTPDEKFNLMLNVWNQYQSAVTFDMARNSGYYHGGLLFGTGMRDQFQDILGVVMVNPERVRARLLNALRFQFKDGSTLHNFFKITDWGERTNHSDTPLWIPFGIIEYLNETGDFSILDEIVNFYDEGEANVYEHMKRSLDFAISATTERGIPKIMNGDWNDTLDHVGPLGKGETIWGGFFLAYCLKKTFELLEYRNDNEILARWKNVYEHLGEVINENAWDGEWYIRAFRDNGEPLGSKKHKQGKIFINSQTWSVISGLAPKERANKSLSSVKKYLAKPNGIQICWPSYTKVEDNVGLISRCVPGKKENGAIFNHASSWFVLASIINGDVDFAYDVYMRMNPLNSGKNIDRYEVEPYVYAEYVTSPDHPTDGQASHSWLTGTAVWMLRIGLDKIIGFATSLNGITISPNIPSTWKGFKAERNFRGKRILLEVKNPSGRNSGFSKIIINGKEAESNFINVNDYKEGEIRVEMVM